MKLVEAAAKRGFITCVEAVPPEDPNLGPLLDYISSIKGLADFANVSDAPGRKPTMSALYVAHRVKEEAAIEPVLHVNCRDYNRRAVAGILLAAASSGIMNVLAVTGDRTPPGEGGPADVFDLRNSVELIRFARRRLGDALCVGCVANPSAEDLDVEVSKTVRKLEAGAEFVQTQPVYDVAALRAFVDAVRRRGFQVPVICGILPLKGAKNAEFLERRLGIRVPSKVKERVKGRGLEEGKKVAVEVAVAAKDVCEGIIIFTLGRDDLAEAAKEVLEACRTQ